MGRDPSNPLGAAPSGLEIGRARRLLLKWASGEGCQAPIDPRSSVGGAD